MLQKTARIFRPSQHPTSRTPPHCTDSRGSLPTMRIPLVACKKKTDSSDKITSDDPYFSVKMSEIMPILAEDSWLRFTNRHKT